ncbi:MAG TPA: UbiH/UbiF family hydroxylase [Hyphomicrobiaceae bacterium]|nr:UbiH/UbiF family hydroxylase [Hyphomicrobiaceae bacterium]
MTPFQAPVDAEIAVIGGGPAGLAAALALARLGCDVTLLAPPYTQEQARTDTRTTALLTSSVSFMENIGVWQTCAPQSAPLAGVRIADDRGSLLHNPEVLFEAADLGMASFGANIPNAALTSALHAAAARSPNITRRVTSVTRVTPGPEAVRLDLEDGGTLNARCVAAADGRHSLARTAARIAVRSWSYPQSAVATTFHHDRPHNNLSIELHRRSGPLTTVPLPGSASSLVWVEAPDEAQRLASLGGAEFADALAERLQGALGQISGVGPRAIYPLSGLRAERMAAHRIALVGEAAHVIPPIGAQGLNLGLRDAAALAECIADARARGDDAGGESTMAAYHAARAGDVLTRSLSIDMLNRSLLTDFLPVEALRSAGLHLLASVTPLRRMAMRAGLGAAGPLPRLMQTGNSR